MESAPRSRRSGAVLEMVGSARAGRRYCQCMAQNVYDDEGFFNGYSTLPRSVDGLDGAPEWPTLQAMLPLLIGNAIVDLGCGFGWFSRWAIDHGASSVLAIDISERMLAKAVSETVDGRVSYERQDLDQLVLPSEAFDVAYSSLTLHYLANLQQFFNTVCASLVIGGSFVFSVEHPIFSAPSTPGFVTDREGVVTWPLNRYLSEGLRTTNWFAPGIEKQHRTIGTYVNLLIGAGFALGSLVEWCPTSEQIAHVPAWTNEVDRPAFLLISATRRE
jgi:SAM-dependent methyltransferase